MRILMLSQFIPPTIGGEERHVANLSVELAARGHDVAIATLWQEGFPEVETDRGVRIYRIRGTMQRISMLFSESDRRYAPPFPDPELLAGLRRIILKEHPDIVHAHNWLLHSFTPIKTWSKAKFVVSLHDYSLFCVQKRLMREDVSCSGPAFKKCMQCSTAFYGLFKGPPSTLAHRFWVEQEKQAVDMFLPVSQAVAEGNQLERYKLPYRVIPNFIPDQIEVASDESHPVLAQLPKKDFLLFVGDITADKGGEVLLEAYEEMDIDMPLVLIGRPFLKDLVERLPPKVLLLGRCPHDVVMAAWRRCSIGLVPSIVADSCPTVALEAMMMGKPLIASRSGGLPDMIVDDKTGYLVPPGDPQALRQAIQRLVADPVQREFMGKMAKQQVVQFQARSVVSRIEQVYQEVSELCAV